jgi:hypothetical protein
MTRQNIVIWSLAAAILLGTILVGTMLYIANMQYATSAAVAAERAHFDATQTADAR